MTDMASGPTKRQAQLALETMETNDIRVTAHHEAGHAVAVVLRGGTQLISVTIDPDEDYRGRTVHRVKAFGDDGAFITYAGPWAEARYQWREGSEDPFEDYVAGAFLSNLDGDAEEYRGHLGSERAAFEAANQTGKTYDELFGGRERFWSQELERRWPEIQEVAQMLLDGEEVDHETIDQLLWGDDE